MLPQALENLFSQVPGSWWRRQQSLVSDEQRKAVLQPLQLCGRERWPMGLPALHKFANYLNQSQGGIYICGAIKIGLDAGVQ